MKTALAFSDDDPKRIMALSDDDAELLLSEAIDNLAHGLRSDPMYWELRHGHALGFSLACNLCLRG